MSVNKVILFGNLGADPQFKPAKDDKLSVASLSLATHSKDETEWHRVVAFGRLAELCNTYLKKGSQAYVEGRIKSRKYQDKDGNDRYSFEIIASNVQFTRSIAATDSTPPPSEVPDMPESSANNTAPVDDIDDEQLDL